MGKTAPFYVFAIFRDVTPTGVDYWGVLMMDDESLGFTTITYLDELHIMSSWKTLYYLVKLFALMLRVIMGFGMNVTILYCGGLGIYVSGYL
jgi:hypothetical protein